MNLLIGMLVVVAAGVMVWLIALRQKAARNSYRPAQGGQEIDDNTQSKLMFLTQFFRQGNPMFGKGVDPKMLIARARDFLGNVPRELSPRLYDILDECQLKGQLPEPPTDREDEMRARDLENWARYRQQLQNA